MITLTRADGIITDNDYYYLDTIRAYASSKDGTASFSFHKHEGELIVHIKPSEPDFKQDIINSLLSIHRLMGLKIIFSKSLGISKTVSYTISL